MNIICKVADTESERSQAFRIRKQVFVAEQGLFESTDRDEFDADATLIIATGETGIVGTVRVYEEHQGEWIGGRLAVLKEHRTGKVGSLLVREAVRTVEAKGARRFLAFIQLQNVRFFRRLGWQSLGPVVMHCGVFHQKMAAALYRSEFQGEPRGTIFCQPSEKSI
jgi:putative N-acetyltransferase (TIGR04045 family)